MSRRKAFSAGYQKFVIADEYAEQVYIGAVTLADLPKELRAPEPKSYIGVWIVGAFSVFAIGVGYLIARAWH